MRFFGSGRCNDPTAGLVCKDLHLHSVSLEDFLTSKYALWIDLRSTDDNKLHGSGRRIENGSEGITIQIEKEQEDDKPIKIYIFIVMDAQLNIAEKECAEAIQKNSCLKRLVFHLLNIHLLISVGA